MKNTLKKDLQMPLNKVERKWLRRSALIILTPLMTIIASAIGICEYITELYEECW